MSSRKFAVGMLLVGLAVGAIPTFAQESAQEPAQGAEAGPLVPVAVAGDLLGRAGAAFDAGDYEQAVQDYSLFILLNPTFSQGYYLRGRAYSQMNDLDHALDDLNTALAYPQPSEQFTGLLYNDRALIYLLQDDVEAALKDLAASIAAIPDLPDAYSRRARVYLANQQYEEALQDYDKWIELDPLSVQAYGGRALAHMSLEDNEAAMADYDKLLELEPENVGAYMNRAILHLAGSDLEAALTDMNAAIELLPNDPSLYLQRALVHQALENPTAAAEDYLAWMRRQETRRVAGDRLLAGESQVLALSAGVTYNLPFAATAGQQVTLSASARADAETDPLLVLLDTAGKAVAGDDDSGGNYDAAITDYLIPADGVYTLVVSYAGGGADGPVRVLLAVGE